MVERLRFACSGSTFALARSCGEFSTNTEQSNTCARYQGIQQLQTRITKKTRRKNKHRMPCRVVTVPCSTVVFTVLHFIKPHCTAVSYTWYILVYVHTYAHHQQEEQLAPIICAEQQYIQSTSTAVVWYVFFLASKR